MDTFRTNNLPIRKPNRLAGYDYARNGAYFVTICAKNREEIFGFVGTATQSSGDKPLGVDRGTNDNGRPQIILYDIGRNIDTAINNIPKIHSGVYINKYVIMPNHVHLILFIDHNGKPSDVRNVTVPTIHSIIGGMKRVVSMQYKFPVWQKSFHDHVIRNKKEALLPI